MSDGGPNPSDDFVEVIASPLASPPSPFPSFAHLLFQDRDKVEDPIVLMGSVEQSLVRVSLGQLRRSTLAIIRKLSRMGLQPGDTVCLLRLPRTSETLIAAAYVALSVWGIRVLLPMFVEPGRIGDWLRASNARLLLWNEREVRDRHEVEADLDLLTNLAREAEQAGVRTCCVERDLGVPDLLHAAPDDPLDETLVRSLLKDRHADEPCLLLTTSGTSGRSKMVLYTQGGFLRGCAAWEQAGLFRPERLGGCGLCLLFAHSMGIRALWNALWTRVPLCLIPPEWFAEHPERARSFLEQMRAEHITGGPAVYRTLIELARLFPRLKDESLGAIRCAVSSGAPFDPPLAARLHAALELRLHNALGLTETQQVASTVVDGPLDCSGTSLGNLLPGVRIGLAVSDDTKRRSHRLFVASPFGAEGYLEDGQVHALPGPKGWFDTGDLVERTDTGLRYLARDTADFFKDGFGVKIPRARVLELYDGLGAPVLHIEPFALRDEPGLGALVFVDHPADDRTARDGRTTGPPALQRVRDLLIARLEVLRAQVEELEFRHLTISRFVCIHGSPPRTAKGEVSRAEVLALHESTIRSLSGRFIQGPGRDRLPREVFARARAARLMNPRRAELLHLARLDKDFFAARGDTLTYRHRGEPIDVFDFVGGFGGNLLGHRHPAILEAMRSFLDGTEPPIGDQGSAQRAAGLLAKSLAVTVGRQTGSAYVVRLGSTGSEAVEMAIAHAQLERHDRLRRLHRELRQSFASIDADRVRACIAEGLRIMDEQRPKLLVLSSAFHGHSLAARSALGQDKHRRPFTDLSRIERITIDPEIRAEELSSLLEAAEFELPFLEQRDDQLQASSVRCSQIVAALVEPILGEGGVRVVPTELMRRLGDHEFPLIFDEIQCGLGRTGSLLASEGTHGHYYLFAKALGGGLAKVSAVLIERSRYVERFDEHYASTFAGDALSSTIATAVLDHIERDDVPGRARLRGLRLRRALDRVREAFPEIFVSVRGRGLMLGLELDPGCTEQSIMLRGLALYEHLGFLASSVLLHRYQVRLLPTLSAPNTLRIEPSAYIEDAAIDRLEEALRWLGSALRQGLVADLVEHLVEQEKLVETEVHRVRGNRIDTEVAEPAEHAARVGFVNHFVLPEQELALSEPSLARLSPTQRRALFHRFMELLELKPILGFARNILDQSVWFLSVANTTDAATFESLHRSNDRSVAVERVQQAVELAASHGCSVIALGAYASIITNNGTAIEPPPDTSITSGNTLTVAVAARRITHACRAQGIDPAAPTTTLGIVGATGNIGATLSHRLLTGPNAFHRARLVSRSPKHFPELRKKLRGISADLTLSDDLASLRDCDVIAVAVNTSEPLVLPHHIGRPITVIGDVSVPGAVSSAVRKSGKVRFVSLAGVVALPGEPAFVMSSHSPMGTAFCCAAEAMLLGLEPRATRDLKLVGDVDAHAVAVLDELAEQHAWLDPLTSSASKP
jgi:acetylornithine/succinyldiaminopimelate/putrescine aminotransferase/predicted amino acid dehydrogenase/acyl-coenzyme A synthetase/AMP-(fatty) acid ligase